MQCTDAIAIVRMGLIYGHLLAFAVSAAAVAFGDFAMFSRRRVDMPLLTKAASIVTWGLTALWVTGLGIIWLDTGFVASDILTRGKLVAKLAVVTVLTINGIALHHVAFPAFKRWHRRPFDAAALPAVLGAISMGSWLYAALLGVGKALTAVMNVGGFLALYAAVLALGISTSLAFIRPRLATQMSASRPDFDDTQLAG